MMMMPGRALVRRIVEEWGRLDILITNAGGPPSAPFLSLSAEDFNAAVELNLMSAVHLCYAAVPQMIEQGGGSIVTITSLSVKQPVDNLILSNSVRLAVIGLTKAMAHDVAEFGIRVNAVAPGVIDSPLRKKSSPEANEAMKQEIPLKRFGTSEEVADAVLFLVSDFAKYITGETLVIDGGWKMA